eukprot:Blabericola_migrator_1__590@NODE_1145_length_5293_cov_76_243781_g779_i0_p4_GENE_NODE_1145_length_5293_cov_76_243781_g779_i0NODE_1145_length_5293_cov_76_243781_g779_i0_p4_ORF_typecomplete_len211_score22_44SpoU_methylase/PF00588_19/2_3e28SpoU_methylase/PF00588_19/2_5e03_NODE_1145_length_5293_cov_76_243781_g779_i039654597
MEGYLILNNIGKRQNYGTLIRSAAAMGFTDLFVVGQRKLRTFGNQGTLTACNFHYWDKLNDLKDFLITKDIEVCGVEISPEAQSIDDAVFTKSTAFLLGNEGTGMSDRQLAICDRLVYIPQFGNATASLNVAVAGSIIFYMFARQCNRQEAARQAAKYIVSGAHEIRNWSQPSEPKVKGVANNLENVDIDGFVDLEEECLHTCSEDETRA